MFFGNGILESVLESGIGRTACVRGEQIKGVVYLKKINK